MNVVTHAYPTGDAGLTPCCGRSLYSLPRTDRLTRPEREGALPVDCPEGIYMDENEVREQILAGLVKVKLKRISEAVEQGDRDRLVGIINTLSLDEARVIIAGLALTVFHGTEDA